MWDVIKLQDKPQNLYRIPLDVRAVNFIGVGMKHHRSNMIGDQPFSATTASEVHC